MILVPLALLGWLVGGEPLTPEERYRMLAERHAAIHEEFLARDAAAEAGEVEFERPLGHNPRCFAPRFLALADLHPESPAAEDALIWICARTFDTTVCEEAKRRLASEYVDSPKLAPAVEFQGYYSFYFEGTESFLRNVLARNPDREIQGLACYWLARHLLRIKEGVELARGNEDSWIERYHWMFKDAHGADWAERLVQRDPEALEREAIALFERVLRDYPDVTHQDKRRTAPTLGEVVKTDLYELRHLTIGKVAPEIEGIDLDGRPFRLSDYRGQVVVLDFGSHFYCGLCRQTYPRLQSLIERNDGQPFAVISINSEPEKRVEELKDAWEAEGNTWRCLFDDTWEGPIQKAWNIREFPTIYVLDDKGVIRFKNHGGPALEEAVERLMDELGETADTGSSSAKLGDHRSTTGTTWPRASRIRHFRSLMKG